jgi:stage V sporulation protein S
VPSKEEDEPGTLRIRGVSKPKAVAGAIANKLRAGESFKVNGASPPARPRSFPPVAPPPNKTKLDPPPFFPSPPSRAAIGADSVNQGIKAVIIARSYLKDDNIDLAIRPTVVDEVGPDVLSLAISKHATTACEGADEEFSFKSAGATQASALAGALAAKIREGCKLLSVTSVGPAAALRSIKSIAMAASYVKEEGFSIYAVPVFVDLKMGEEDRTGVRLDVFAAKA